MDEIQNQVPPVLPAQDPIIKKPWYKSKVLAVIAVFIVVLVAAGGVFYTVYASPSKVWQRFISKALSSKDTIVKEDFNFSYQDNGKLSKEVMDNNPFVSMFTKISFSVGGKAYLDMSNPDSLDGDGDFNYSFSSGGTGFNAKLKVIAKGKDFYIKLGDIPFIAGALSELNNGEPIDWAKINFQDLVDQEKLKDTQDINSQIKKYKEILVKYQDKILVYDKVLGHEKVHGVYTVHIANKLDKVQLKNMVSEMIDYAASQAQNETQEQIAKDKQLVSAFVNTFVDKMELTTFESWLGVFDAKLYRIKVVSSAPSLASLISASAMADKDESIQGDELKILDSVMKNTAFDGVINVDEDLYDYGKTQEVKAPENAFDLGKKLKEEQQIKNNQMMTPPENIESSPVQKMQ